mmetsp:Transcript_15011/g.37804  ORF Transcript_15011/g.37804 Transcript_15011/m.37804 type:complete len:219 (+) Transcript_15011:963-1619(+)
MHGFAENSSFLSGFFPFFFKSSIRNIVLLRSVCMHWKPSFVSTSVNSSSVPSVFSVDSLLPFLFFRLWLYSIRERTSAILTMPSSFNTRCASRMKSARLVPIKAKQKTQTSTDLFSSGTSAMSQAVTRSLGATRSKECTSKTFWFFFLFTFSRSFASWASPHPKSATTHFSDFFTDCLNLEVRDRTITSTGFSGHDSTWCRNPSWYCSKSSGFALNLS